MSSELGIGNIITTQQYRDAIHVAIAPMIAGHDLFAGQHVGKNDKNELIADAEKIGIVDPYLEKRVKKGECCWLFLYPNTVTSLRHEWTHPKFTKENTKDVYEDATRQVAEQVGVSYDELMDTIDSAAMNEYFYENMGENENYKDVPYGEWGKVWQHYQNLNPTIKINKDAFGTCPYSCSC